MEMESVNKTHNNLETNEEENGTAELRRCLAREKERKAFVLQEGRERERKLVVVRRLFVHIVVGSDSSAHVNNTLDSSHRSQGLGIPASFLS
jgi:hypothetical protein